MPNERSLHGIRSQLSPRTILLISGRTIPGTRFEIETERNYRPDYMIVYSQPLSMITRCTTNPRTFLKTRMSSRPNLRPDMSHGLATPYFAPIGKEKVHLNLANLIKRGREGRENFMGDVCDREGFGNVLARSFLQVLQVEFWVTWVRLDSLWARGGGVHSLSASR